MVSDFQKQGIETASFLLLSLESQNVTLPHFSWSKSQSQPGFKDWGNMFPYFIWQMICMFKVGRESGWDLWRLFNEGSRKKWKEYELWSQVALDFNLFADPAVLLLAHYLTSLSLSFYVWETGIISWEWKVVYVCIFKCTAIRHLTMGMHSKKCLVRWFYHRVTIMECTYTNLDGVAYYTPGLYGTAYCC